MTFLVLKFVRRLFLLRWGSNFMSQEYTDSPLVFHNKPVQIIKNISVVVFI